MATITDQKNFKLTIVNKERFSALSVTDQKIFEQLRNSILEFFPYSDGKFDDMSINLAENFAFINLIGINSAIDLKMTEKFAEYDLKISQQFAKLASSNPLTSQG